MVNVNMRVAIFTDTFLPQVNGVARTIGRLAWELKKRAIAYLVLAPESGPSGEHDHNVHLSPGLAFPFYPECKIAVPGYSDISARLDKFAPDVVHLVTEFSMGLYGLKYALSRGLPLVSSYHTNIPQYLSYYGFSFLSEAAWKYMRWFHNKCAINYCPSRDTMDLLVKNGILNLAIWDRGVDTSHFSPLKREQSFKSRLGAGSRTVLLYVGRLAAEKDLDVLMSAFRTVRLHNKDVHLVITGSGPLEASLRSEAAGDVTFTGYLEGEELAATYASSDIFLFPSTTETFGNVILEAMASGLPVVGAYSGGVKDNLIDHYNGLACRPRSAEDMAGAVHKLLADEPLRKSLSVQARLYALEKSWDGAMQKLINGYSSVLGKPAGSPNKTGHTPHTV
jgi:glycosyltransferase involved in cell wall biosynthesis